MAACSDVPPVAYGNIFGPKRITRYLPALTLPLRQSASSNRRHGSCENATCSESSSLPILAPLQLSNQYSVPTLHDRPGAFNESCGSIRSLFGREIAEKAVCQRLCTNQSLREPPNKCSVWYTGVASPLFRQVLKMCAYV